MIDEEDFEVEKILEGELEEREEYLCFRMDLEDYLIYDDPDVYED